MQVTTTGPAWLTCYSYYYLDLLVASSTKKLILCFINCYYNHDHEVCVIIIVRFKKGNGTCIQLRRSANSLLC